MGIRKVLGRKMGIEHREIVEVEVVRKQGYEIEAVCDTEEEIERSVGVGIGIGGDEE